MGYSLTIGEAEIAYDVNQEDVADFWVRIDAKEERHDDAPAFGEPTDYTNSRWPSYGTWYDFCVNANLKDVFFTNDGHLHGGHPGCQPITKKMKERVDRSYMLLKGKDDAEWDFNRVVWLKYWVDWALENCEQPIIANS